MKQITKALIEAQKEMGDAKKGATNPYFKSKYADLNAIREACIPVLNKHGIAVLQPTVHIEGRNFVKTVLLHESGESIESLTEIIYSRQNDAQAQGSGITYARRYGLQSLVNIGAEDDDGNKASQPTKLSKLTAGQASTIETLLKNANISEKQRDSIHDSYESMSLEKADECIAWLEERQTDAIESGRNYSQTDVNKKLSKIK